MFNEKINSLITLISGVIFTGCVIKIIQLMMSIMQNPDEKQVMVTKIKHILVVVVITLLASSYSIWSIISYYFSTF